MGQAHDPAIYALGFIAAFIVLDWVQLAARSPGRTGNTDLELPAMGVAAAIAVFAAPWVSAFVTDTVAGFADLAGPEFQDAPWWGIDSYFAGASAVGLMTLYAFVDYFVRAKRNDAALAGHGCWFTIVAYFTYTLSPLFYLLVLSRRNPLVRVLLLVPLGIATLSLLAPSGAGSGALAEALRGIDGAGFVVFAIGDTLTSAFAVPLHPAIVWAVWGALFGMLPGVRDGMAVLGQRHRRTMVSRTPMVLMLGTMAVTVGARLLRG